MRDDLIAYLGEGARVLSDPLIQRVMPYLIAQARSSPDLAQAVHQLPGPTREDGRAVLRRAIDRGELPPGTDIELALDLIVGPMLMHGVLLG